jgi:LuxR family maltose regulon positive regulatory protein
MTTTTDLHLELLARAEALSAALDDLLADIATLQREGAGPTFTDAERRLIPYVRGPLRLTEIAREVHLSHNTVKTQASALYRRLGVHSRAEARQKLRTVKL